MIKKIWEDFFHSSKAEGLSIASDEDVEQIINMLIADKIDPRAFFSNLETLLRGGMPSFNDFWGIKEDRKPTQSVSHFTSIINRPIGVPLWFLAAYPDVMVWFHEQQEKYLKSHNLNDNATAVETAKLFGIKAEDANINENQIMNSDGQCRPKYYKNLVQSYKDATDKKLEVSVDENSKNNIYLGAEFLDMIGTKSNFTFIAENTTKYYLELTKNYKNRFNDETSLLATAGILDALVYIFMDQTINPQEIIDIAQKSVSSKEESLIDFIIKLEVKLFKIDTPDLDISEIENACIKQKADIVKAIQKTKEKYTSEPRFASDVANFMSSAKFKPYRQMLGIKNKFLFF